MKIGQLEIDLFANVARLQADMNQVKNAVGGSMAEVRRVTDLASKAMAALGVALSVGALMAWVRSAVDAADATKQISEKTGLAAKDVAGLQLAYQQAGVSGDGMTSSIVKMSKAMVDGNKAFDDLGVKTRNTDGTMRDSKEVLYDVADAFKGMEAGSVKSTLAMEIFGKSGADMIPLLNSGAEGLQEMADMAERLGLVIDQDTAEAADKFNDTTELLGMGLQGVSRQVAAQLLPTLNSLAGVMLENMTQGDTLSRVADGLAVAFKGVYTVVAVVVEAFATAGRYIGGVSAAIVQALTGDFAGARDTWNAMTLDIQKSWGNTASSISKVWSNAGGEAVAAMSSITGGLNKLKPATKEQEEASKALNAEDRKRSAEIKKLEAAGLELLTSMRRRNDLTAQEMALGRGLTESERATLDLENELADGKIRLTAETQDLIRAEIQRMAGLEAEVKLEEANARWLDMSAKANQQASEAVKNNTLSLQEQIGTQRQANEQVGLSAEELARVEVAHLRDAAAASERTAALMDEVDWTGATSKEYRDQAEALRELARLKDEGISIQAAKDSASEWKKTTDSIEKGLSDALMRGFESGKGFAENFKSVLVNAFKTMVLEPNIRMVLQSAGSSLSSLGSTVSSSLGFSGASMSSLGPMAAIAAVSYSLSRAISGDRRVQGPMGTILDNLGAVGGLLNRLFGGGGTAHTGAATTTDAWGMSSINNGTALGLPTYGGFNADRDSKATTALQAIGTSVVGTLTMLDKAFGGNRQFSTAQAYLSDNDDPSRGYFRLWADGQMLANTANRGLSSNRNTGFAQFAEEIAATTRAVLDDMDLPDWAQDTIDALSNTASLDELAAVATAIAETAGQLDAMSDALGPLGGVFARIGNLSSDAQYQLAQFAGGIDALAQKSAAFVQQYYSQDEQIGLQAADLARQFAALGITDGPDTMAEFRALVEGQDLSTEQGRLQLAALLDMADQFAAVQAYIGQFGGTIDGLAANAPAGAVFGELTAAQERQATIAQQQADLAARQAAAAEATVGAITTMSASLGSKLDAVRQALTEGFERQAAANDALRYGGV